MIDPRVLRGAKAILAAGGLGLSLAASGFGLSAAEAAPAAPACDEACLKAVMDGYLDALSHHDAKRLPVARKVRFTEQGAELNLGEGLWVTFGSLGPYRHDFYDPSAGEVATFVTATENGIPDIVSIRLKVVRNEITEVETVISRNARSSRNLPSKDPSWMQIFNRVEPQEKRLTREQLIKGAIDYMRAIALMKGDLAPFAESCIRLENGGSMSRGKNDTLPAPGLPAPAGDPTNWFLAVSKTLDMGLGCDKQIDTGVYNFITGYEGARLPLVDVERQIVFGTFDFMRRGNILDIAFDGTTYKTNTGATYPNEMLNSEAWKFVDGKITRIEAVFTGPQAYKLGSGWPGGSPPVERPIGK